MGKVPSPGPEEALETLRLAIATTKSWREKRPVKVSEISV
jgi:predicted dehydrogenase